MTVTPPATLAVDNDITGGLEPVQIPAIGLTADQLQTLLAAFNTYIVDSQLSNGISISDTAAVQHSPFASLETAESPVSDDHISSSGGSDGETDTWTCTCAYSSGIGEGWLCTANDGDACDCVSDFGNFYSLPDEGQSVLLLVHVVPAVRTVSPNTVFGPAVSGIGLGLFYSPSAPVDLPRGTFISLYAGEYLTTTEAQRRWAEQRSSDLPEGQGNYILSLRLPGETIHIDPRHKGNVGRFLNHSCEPNCVIHVVRWGGGEGWPRAAIYSKTVIRPGEELTFDYANASGGPTVREAKGAEEGSNRTRCLCGADRCRGWMPFDESL